MMHILILILSDTSATFASDNSLFQVDVMKYLISISCPPVFPTSSLQMFDENIIVFISVYTGNYAMFCSYEMI